MVYKRFMCKDCGNGMGNWKDCENCFHTCSKEKINDILNIVIKGL